MTDRELLEMAAKAAGEEFGRDDTDRWIGVDWNPLADDADAFRLAVKLGLEVSCDGRDKVIVGWPDPSHPGSRAEDECVFYSHTTEAKGEDHCIATRRAIVRAAAAIGAKQ